MLDLMAVQVGLFIPASQPRFLARAHEQGADAVVLDLEDGVAANRKEEARGMLKAAVDVLARNGVTVLARVNADDDLLPLDVRAALAAGIGMLIVPKQSSVRQVEAVAGVLAQAERDTGRAAGSTRLVALIESPAAVMVAHDIARASPRVAGLMFGSEDYCASLGIASAGAVLDWPAQQVAVAARAVGLAAFGIPGSIQSIDDSAGFGALVARGRAMGFSGCFCIHPRQVAAALDALRPSAAEVEQARRVVEADSRHGSEGAFAVDGRMIDAPVVEQARALLTRWSRSRPGSVAPPPASDR